MTRSTGPGPSPRPRASPRGCAWAGRSGSTCYGCCRLAGRHGAPLRLRNEIRLGFKQVKWLAGIEFVAHYSEVGSGYDPDHEFFGYRQSI